MSGLSNKHYLLSFFIFLSFRKKDLHGEDYRSQTYHDVKSGDQGGMKVFKNVNIILK